MALPCNPGHFQDAEGTVKSMLAWLCARQHRQNIVHCLQTGHTLRRRIASARCAHQVALAKQASVHCEQCPAGRIHPSAGQPLCEACEPGTIASTKVCYAARTAAWAFCRCWAIDLQRVCVGQVPCWRWRYHCAERPAASRRTSTTKCKHAHGKHQGQWRTCVRCMHTRSVYGL